MTPVIYLFVVALISLIVLGGGADSRDVITSIEFPLYRESGGKLIAHMRVGGKRLALLVDSGSTLTILHPEADVSNVTAAVDIGPNMLPGLTTDSISRLYQNGLGIDTYIKLTNFTDGGDESVDDTDNDDDEEDQGFDPELDILVRVWRVQTYTELVGDLELFTAAKRNPGALALELLTWNFGVDGVIGLSIRAPLTGALVDKSPSCFGFSSWCSHPRVGVTALYNHVATPMFSLLFSNGAGTVESGDVGLLVVGEPPVLPADVILWSQNQPSADLASYYEISMFGLSVCGRDLLSESGVSFVSAIVDTGAACLSLSDQLYSNIMSWLPVECGSASGSSGGALVMCPLSAGVSAEALPTLTFSLTEFGEVLEIALAPLVLQAEGDVPRLCVLNSGPSDTHTVALGSLTLLNFKAVIFDSERLAVGFVQSSDDAVGGSTKSDEDRRCQASVSCVGETMFQESSNSCKAATCQAVQRFGSVFDQPGIDCELHDDSLLGFVVVLVVIGVVLDAGFLAWPAVWAKRRTLKHHS